ncbi:MAG: pilus assembly PilX N-terminal domain-containing protein [Tissierellaceae bacterium]
MQRRGIALPIILVLMALMMVLGTAGFYMVNSQTKFNLIDDSTQTAMKYAEAGYNNYLWHLGDDLNFYSTEEHERMMNKPIEFEDGYYMLEVTKPSDNDRFITIKSTGWTKSNPDIKKSLLAKIRKKQFVHHVYVSNNDGNIWWTTGDESHGPYHTNGNMNIQQSPKFYDVVTYKGGLDTGTGYGPEFYIDKKDPYKPGKNAGNLSYLYKTEELGFPANNKDLIGWAEKDSMVFVGRTCIFLEGDQVVIRNQNDGVEDIKRFSIKNDIPNKVIYVRTNYDNTSDENNQKTYGKFDIRSGNIFISGKLEGKLTIAAEDKIYITHDNPTNWYDYDRYDYNNNKKPSAPPTTAQSSGGITYGNTIFSGNKNGTGTALSTFDNDLKIWTRYALDKNDNTKPGKDMLGLIANNEILILHYGWPKQVDEYGDSWNFKWGNWVNEWKFVGNKRLSNNTTYKNIEITINGIPKFYESIKVTNNGEVKSGTYYVREMNPNWGWQKGTSNSQTYDVAPKDITIHAALFSVRSGFGYEDYDKGPRKGDIVLWGNITQLERKAVGTIGSTGYNKKYAHDPRMFYDYPPKILEPTNVGWEIHEWKEISEHVEEKP